MTSIDVLDLMLRSGAAGICLVLVARLAPLAITTLPARFCALFALGAAAYCIASSPVLRDVAPVVAASVKPFAIMSPIFFWWFGLSLFCDDWRWKPIYLLPMAFVSICMLLEWVSTSERTDAMANLASEAIHILLVLHVMRIIQMGFRDDLVEPRRRIRGWWLGAIGVTIIGAAVVSALRLKTTISDTVLTLEALGLFFTTCLFSAWALSPHSDFFSRASETQSRTGHG